MANTNYTAYFKTYLQEGTGWVSSPQQLTTVTINNYQSTWYDFQTNEYLNRKLGNILGWRASDQGVQQSNTSTLGGDLQPFAGWIPASESDVTYYAVVQEKYKVNFYKHLNDTTPYHSITGTKLSGDTLSSSEMPSAPSEIGFKGWTAYSWIASQTYNELSDYLKTLVFTTASGFDGFNGAQKRSSLTSDGYFEIAFYGVWDQQYSVYFINSARGTQGVKTVTKGDTLSFSSSNLPSEVIGLNTTKYLHRGWYVSNVYYSDYYTRFVGVTNLYQSNVDGYYSTSGGTISGTTASTTATMSNVNVGSYSSNLSTGTLYANGSNYLWAADNVGSNNYNESYSMVKISFSTTGPGTLTVNYSVISESTYDGLLFSNLDVSNPFSTTPVTGSELNEVHNPPSYVYGSPISGNSTGSFTYTISNSGDHYFWVKWSKDYSNTVSGEKGQVTSISFAGDTITSSGIQSNLYVYSLQQKKYLHRFYNASNGVHYTTSTPQTISNSITTAAATENNTTISNTGYAFKGWTLKNNTSNKTYTSDTAPYFYKPGINITFSETMITNGTVSEDSDHIYLNFYAVWNPLYTITYRDTLHNKTNTNSYIVEKGTSYLINSSHYTSNTFAVNGYDGGYKFIGWTLRNKDDNNNDRILYGPKVTNAVVYYKVNNVTASNFNDLKSSLYVLSNGSYVSAASLTYSSSTIYYEKILTYTINSSIGTVTGNITLYAMWQRKYTIKFSADGTNVYNDSQTGAIYNSTLITKPSTNPTKTGYVFKGWTYIKDANYRDYGYQFQFNTSGFYSNLNNKITDDMLNTYLSNITTDYNSSTGTGAFYLWFYAVWNKAYTINFIVNYGSTDSNNIITKTNSYIAEQGTSITINSTYLPSIPDVGYSLQGWTERLPFINNNPNGNVIGPNATRSSSTRYEEISFENDTNGTLFAAKKMSLYIYDETGETYTLLVPNNTNPATISYDSNQTYYEAFFDLSSTGSTINQRKVYQDLTYYAILKKQYIVIFKNTDNSNFLVKTPQNINTSVTKPSSSPTITYSTPTINYNATGTNNYGFSYDTTNNEWISQNGGHKNSYALGTFSFTTPSSCCLLLEAECVPAGNYYNTDIGYFSKLDNTNFSEDSSQESSLKYFVTSESRNAGKFYVLYEIPSAGQHSFQVKYRRGTSTDGSATDYLKFKVSFINLNKSFQGWTLDSVDHSYETKNDDSDFYANNLPNITDAVSVPVDINDPMVGPFTITYYPVFSNLYYLAFHIAPTNSSDWYPIQVYYNLTYKQQQAYNTSQWSIPMGTYLTNGFNILSWTSTKYFGDQTGTQGGYNATSGIVSNITSNLNLYANQQKKYQGQFFKFVSDTSAYSTDSSYKLLTQSPTRPVTNPTATNAVFKAWTLEKKLGYYYNLSAANLEKVFTTIPVINSSTPSTRLNDGTFVIKYYGVWNPKYSITIIDTLNSTVIHQSYCVDHGTNYNLNKISNIPTSTNGYNMVGLRKIGHYQTPDTNIPSSVTFSGDYFNFGFKPSDNEINTWESTNQSHNNSFSYGKFYIKLNTPGTIQVTAQNNTEKNYDYGVFSQLDQELSFGSTIDDATKVLMTGKGYTTQYSCSYNIEDTNEHYITVKYIKDGSQHIGDDKLKFSISLINDDIVLGPNVIKTSNDYLFSNSINSVTENLIFSVLWQKKYRVIFKASDGNNYSTTINKILNDTITTPKATDVTKTNYNLKGWTRSTNSAHQNYLSRDNDNFYLPNTSITIEDYSSTQDENGYFNIIYFPVWTRVYTVTFKDIITNTEKVNNIEETNNFNITSSTALSLSTSNKGYTYLGWTLRDPSINTNVVSPTAEKLSGDYEIPSASITSQTISNVTNNIILWAIAKKKYTLRFHKDNGSVTDSTFYYINSNGPSSITDTKTNYYFKGWTLDSEKRIYDPNETIYTSNTVPITDALADPADANGYFYIHYYSVFNRLYTVSYYEYKNNEWTSKKEEAVEQGTTYEIKNITGITNKTEYELIGWNTSQIFPNTENPTYNLYGASTNTSFIINNSVSLYTAWRRRYAIQLISDDGTSLSTITYSFPTSQSTSGNIRYYNRNQTLTITLTVKQDYHCFKTYTYDEGENDNDIITVGNKSKNLIYTIQLDPNIYNDSAIHEIHYSLGKGLKFTTKIDFENINSNHTATYYNNNFYLNDILLENNETEYSDKTNYLEKTYSSTYYFPGDTITYKYSHALENNVEPYYEYYIDHIIFYENGTYNNRGTGITQNTNNLNISSTNNTEYTYTHTIVSDDIVNNSTTGKAIEIIPYYVPYNNIIHIKSDEGFIIPINTSNYTFKSKTQNTYLTEGYIYVLNGQSSDLQVSLTNRNNYIPLEFKYKEPSTSLQTCSIYDFLNHENPNTILPKFYYSDKYTFHSIGLNLSATDTNTYHSNLYELQESGYFGGLQRVKILSNPLNKITITKPNTTISSDSTNNSLIFYINSANLLNNSIEYSIQDVKDSGISFKELIIDTSSGIQTINKSQIVDEGLPLPVGWTRQQTTDHTDIITYTNNNFSARNGYIDYITITFAESLPLFYINSKGIQLYWENTKAEGLYWENIKLL